MCPLSCSPASKLANRSLVLQMIGLVVLTSFGLFEMSFLMFATVNSPAVLTAADAATGAIIVVDGLGSVDSLPAMNSWQFYLLWCVWIVGVSVSMRLEVIRS